MIIYLLLTILLAPPLHRVERHVDSVHLTYLFRRGDQRPYATSISVFERSKTDREQLNKVAAYLVIGEPARMHKRTPPFYRFEWSQDSVTYRITSWDEHIVADLDGRRVTADIGGWLWWEAIPIQWE